jgi:mono/diheme cytochrome c family protein
MRNFLFGVLTALVLLPMGILGCFAFGFTEIRGDLKPSRWESVMMDPAVGASVRRSAAGIANAATPNNETLIAGGQLYVAGCGGCHGELGKPLREDHDHFPTVPQLPYVQTQYSEPEL